VLSAAYNDVRQAPAPLAAAEMALLKLSLAGQMPPPELAAAIIAQAGFRLSHPVQVVEQLPFRLSQHRLLLLLLQQQRRRRR